MKSIALTALALLASTAPVLSCGCQTVRMNHASQVQQYLQFSGGWGSGEVCHAETGSVYLRGEDLKPSKNRRLSNGTRINFIGSSNGYAHVIVSKTGTIGYITLRYTCGYNS